METITQGSIEYLVVKVRDRLKHLTTLVGTAPKYSIRVQYDDTNWVVDDQDADVDNDDEFTLLCLANTTNWDIGRYELFVKFINFPETPTLGPFTFDVA